MKLLLVFSLGLIVSASAGRWEGGFRKRSRTFPENFQIDPAPRPEPVPEPREPFQQTKDCPPWKCQPGACQNEPTCCPSGKLTLDKCGCCKVCAEPESQTLNCGGIYGSKGRCSKGTQCLKFCGCNDINGAKCVFPFKYKGKTHYKCTTEDYVKPWCAKKVDRDGEVTEAVECNDYCPGPVKTPAGLPEVFRPASSECSSNAEGHCVRKVNVRSLASKLKKEGVAGVSVEDEAEGQWRIRNCRGMGRLPEPEVAPIEPTTPKPVKPMPARSEPRRYGYGRPGPRRYGYGRPNKKFGNKNKKPALEEPKPMKSRKPFGRRNPFRAPISRSIL